MNKKVDNRFVPNYVPNNLPWHERDGLMTWYDQVKCQEFHENTDSHFQNLEIVNFDIIKSNGNLPEQKLKQYQRINYQDILSYPPNLQEEIMWSIFRAKREGMHVQKEMVIENFKKLIKSVGRGRFIKKIKDDHYKETW